MNKNIQQVVSCKYLLLVFVLTGIFSPFIDKMANLENK